MTIDPHAFYHIVDLQRFSKKWAKFSKVWLYKLAEKGRLPVVDIRRKGSKKARYIMRGSDVIAFLEK